MTDGDLRLTPTRSRVAIVGTGFAGVGAAIALRRAGIEDFMVFERAGDVGGTWRDNTYPGCQCDVPSHLYSFSFAPNPDWTRTYSLQAEIGAYIRRTAVKHDVLSHTRFHAPVEDSSLERRRPALDPPHPRRQPHRRRAGHGQRSAERAEGARCTRPRPFPGDHVPLRRLGSRPRLPR